MFTSCDYSDEPQDLSISVLNTETSDCCILINTNGSVTMIDTSFSSQYDNIKDYLSENKITEIENLIITHASSAHIGCADKIIADYGVKYIYTTNSVVNSHSFKKVSEAANANSAEIIIPEAGASSVWGNLTVNFLSSGSSQYESSGDSSLVVQFEYNKHKFLFTGDISPATEESLVQQYGNSLKSDFLKVPCHGENTSCTEDFIKSVSPKLSIITCSKDSDPHLPGNDLISRIKKSGSYILRTDELGNITVYSEGSGALKYKYN